MRTDKQGNYIGDGRFHVDYFTYELPGVTVSVVKSETTESVYVTYSSDLTGLRITVRFSSHENNAVKWGDQLNGYLATKNEILYRVGMKKRTFIPNTKLSVPYVAVKRNTMHLYEEADLTLSEMYALGAGADLTNYNGKLAKGGNRLITGDKVYLYDETRLDAFGNSVKVGIFIYE